MIESQLVNGASVHGELCPGGILYHHWEHMHANESRSVRFTITKHGGDGSVMLRHGKSLDEAPLKLEPPYEHMGPSAHSAAVQFCNATDAVQSNDHVYVMMVGGEHCFSYEIVAAEVPNHECVGMGHGSAHAADYAAATPIAPHHYVYASCAGSEWVDFQLSFAPSDYHYNYLIEAEDLSLASTGHPEPEALSLHNFGASIPASRQTEDRASRAIDGIYSLAINRHNFAPGANLISVRCEDAGASSRRFRLL